MFHVMSVCLSSSCLEGHYCTFRLPMSRSRIPRTVPRTIQYHTRGILSGAVGKWDISRPDLPERRVGMRHLMQLTQAKGILTPLFTGAFVCLCPWVLGSLGYLVGRINHPPRALRARETAASASAFAGALPALHCAAPLHQFRENLWVTLSPLFLSAKQAFASIDNMYVFSRNLRDQ